MDDFILWQKRVLPVYIYAYVYQIRLVIICTFNEMAYIHIANNIKQ